MQVGAGTSKKNRPTSGISHNVALTVGIGLIVCVQKSFGFYFFVVTWSCGFTVSTIVMQLMRMP